MSSNEEIRNVQSSSNKNDEIPKEIRPAAGSVVSPSSLEDSTAASTNSAASASSSSLSWDEARRRRIAIIEVYKHMGEPAQETWYGRKGVISTLSRVFDKTSVNTIKKVLTDYHNNQIRGN